MEQGISEQRRISIKNITLSKHDRSLYHEVSVDYSVQIPIDKYAGKSPDGTKHIFKKTIAVEFEGTITFPVDPVNDNKIVDALITLKEECEKKLSKILHIDLDSNSPEHNK